MHHLLLAAMLAGREDRFEHSALSVRMNAYHHVLQPSEFDKWFGFREGAADPRFPQPMRRLAGYILFHKRHPSRCRRCQAANEIESRSLAGTIRSDQTTDLARFNIHGN